MNDQVKIALIGGSGLYHLIENPKITILDTPWGKSPRIDIGYIGIHKIAFVSRHSKPGVSDKQTHAVPPHMVNYKAYIYALRQLGVERIIATTAVGSLNKKIKPGDFVILDQLVDFTKRRSYTFFDGTVPIEVEPNKIINGVAHVDFTEPYCPEIRTALIESCKLQNIKCHTSGTYVAMEGPRFETRAEVKLLSSWGMDVVGMTQSPEAILARELTMCYGVVSIVTNYAAGISNQKITHEEVVELFNQKMKDLKSIIQNAIKLIPEERNCTCKSALDGAQ